MTFSIFGRQFGLRRRRAVDRIEFTTLIGSGTHYRGDLHGNENYIICGSVDGNCEVEGHVVLAAGSRWHGDIHATYVVIAGDVHGNVRAVEKLELQETAHIVGNITAPVIAMAEGAVYDGEIHMRREVVRFSEKRSGSVNEGEGA